MLAMDVWCFSKSTIRVDLEKHQTRLHYWGNSLCNFEEAPLQFWVFLLCTKQRKERNHRLCSRGGYLESLVPALIDMSEQEARDFLYTAVFSDKAQEFLRKRAGEATPKNYPCTQGRTYTP